MANNSTPQLYSFIQQHHTIFCVAAERTSFDTLATARALVHIAERAGKTARVATANAVPKSLAFLNFEGVTHAPAVPGAAPSFSVRLDTSENRGHSGARALGRVRYRRRDDRLDFFLYTPSGEPLKAHADTADTEQLSWDAVILVGDVAEQELPAALREAVRDGRLAALALCTRPPSVPLAPLTLIEDGASSTAEALTRILKKENEELITEDVATALLTGLIAATQNFQSPATRPQALFATAYLIGKHADKTTVIQHLYKTKPLALVKLWGYVLAKFSYDAASRVGYSTVTLEDIRRAHASPRHAAQVLVELKNNFAQARVLVLAVERRERPPAALIYTSDASIAEALGALSQAQRRGSFLLLPLPSAPSLTAALKTFIAEMLP